jgi:hypothetical protein
MPHAATKGAHAIATPRQGDAAKTWVVAVSWAVALLVSAVIVLDVWAIVQKKGATDTISAHLRNWNANTGGVLALLSAALWIHLFVRLPFTWSEAAARPMVASSYASTTH